MAIAATALPQIPSFMVDSQVMEAAPASWSLLRHVYDHEVHLLYDTLGPAANETGKAHSSRLLLIAINRLCLVLNDMELLLYRVLTLKCMGLDHDSVSHTGHRFCDPSVSLCVQKLYKLISSEDTTSMALAREGRDIAGRFLARKSSPLALPMPQHVRIIVSDSTATGPGTGREESKESHDNSGGNASGTASAIMPTDRVFVEVTSTGHLMIGRRMVLSETLSQPL